MDIDARIRRRQRRNGGPDLIYDYDSLSPVAHVDDPSDRGPVIERLLDYLDPVFDGDLPPSAYAFGPFGSGKSAVVTALFAHLKRLSTERRSIIHTSTRAASPTSPGFVYVDLRETTSEFAFYHAVLDALVDEPVPEHGISTGDLRDRFHDLLGGSRAGVVVATDHVDEPAGTEIENPADLFAGLPSTVSWFAIGRAAPDEAPLSQYTDTTIEVGPYRSQPLADVLLTRASAGLTRQALTRDLARRIADWADGNAHDALAALFVAADRADREGRTRLTEPDVASGLDDVPRPSVSLGRVLALPENKQTVLRALVDLEPDDRASVTASTQAISSRSDVTLSSSTVKRFLYELAETGVVERVQSSNRNGKGRPPSRVEMQFSPTVFRRLYDRQATA